MTDTELTATQLAKQVKIAVFDVDGVMTDGRLFYGSQGDEIKAFNVKDGLGIKLLQQAGIKTAIITGRLSEPVARRAKELNIDYLYQGREDKLTALNELLADTSFSLGDVAYMGDDLPDLPAIRKAALGATVKDATPPIIAHADWISQHKGGEGAVREFCEFILEAQSQLESLYQPYFE